MGGWGEYWLKCFVWQTFIIITSILIVVGNLKEVFIINIFVIWGIYFSFLRKLNYDIFRTRNAKFRAFCAARAGPGAQGS